MEKTNFSCPVLPKTNEFFKSIDGFSLALVIISAMCFVVVFVINVLQIYYAANYISNFLRKRFLINIYGIFGITTLMCLVANVVPRAGPICDVFITLYYANALFMFVNLVVQFHGDRDAMIERLSETQISLSILPCCCLKLCRFPKIKCNLRNIRIIEFLVWQNSIVRLSTIFIFVVLSANLNGGLHGQKSPNVIFTTINTISTLVAIYGSGLYVAASQDILKSFLLSKLFLILKVCIVLFNLQSSIFNLLANSASVIQCTSLLPPIGHASLWNHTAYSVEMLILAFASFFLLGPSKSAAYDKYCGNGIRK